MKKIRKSFLLLLLMPIIASTQTKQKAEKEFVAELNSILKKSTDNDHQNQKGVMTIDSTFTINKEGILSVTVRYTEEDAGFVIIRREAPVNKIWRIAYDLYLLLEFKTDEVTMFKSATNSNELKEVLKTNYLHLGKPIKDGYKQQEKLQQLLNKLLKYYTN